MPQHNILSKKVTLAEDANKNQIVSFSGHLATTGSGDKEPAGVMMYDGTAGDLVAIMCIGLITTPQDGSLKLGDKVKVTAGTVVKATDTNEVFAEVSEVTTTSHVELLLK
ncbi:hypothetical protein [Psychrobacter sp. I-STPA10]|uniref:hypothetical protein n=1 Tax=Psychrobacter sp. I-STPA10 TaxID=2585769 RepID=UPI001E3B9572|nr:hypothetical protein [Psychrobacter sp. I-STPA10]